MIRTRFTACIISCLLFLSSVTTVFALPPNEYNGTGNIDCSVLLDGWGNVERGALKMSSFPYGFFNLTVSPGPGKQQEHDYDISGPGVEAGIRYQLANSFQNAFFGSVRLDRIVNGGPVENGLECSGTYFSGTLQSTARAEAIGAGETFIGTVQGLALPQPQMGSSWENYYTNGIIELTHYAIGENNGTPLTTASAGAGANGIGASQVAVVGTGYTTEQKPLKPISVLIDRQDNTIIGRYEGASSCGGTTVYYKEAKSNGVPNQAGVFAKSFLEERTYTYSWESANVKEQYAYSEPIYGQSASILPIRSVHYYNVPPEALSHEVCGLLSGFADRYYCQANSNGTIADAIAANAGKSLKVVTYNQVPTDARDVDWTVYRTIPYLAFEAGLRDWASQVAATVSGVCAFDIAADGSITPLSPVNPDPSATTTPPPSCEVTNTCPPPPSCAVTNTCPPVETICQALPNPVVRGNAVTLSAAPSGGNGSYTYSWSDGGAAFGFSTTTSRTYQTAGLKYVSVEVTSGNQSVDCLTEVEVTDEPLSITGSCSALPSPTARGNAIVWQAGVPAGGTGSYTYIWSGHTEVNNKTGASVTSDAYATAGLKTAAVTITSGNQSIGRSCSATVVAPPSVDLKINTTDSAALSYGSGGALTWTSANTAGTCSISASPATSGYPKNAVPRDYVSGSDYYTGNLTQTTTFTITCSGQAGSSPTTATDSVTVSIMPQPPAAPGISAYQGVCAAPGTIDLVMSSSARATSYVLSRSPYTATAPNSGWGDIASYTSATLPSSITQTGLVQAGTYSYQLRAVNSGGTTYSQIVSAVASAQCYPDLTAGTPTLSALGVSGTTYYAANTSATVSSSIVNAGAGDVATTFPNEFIISTDGVNYSALSTNHPLTSLSSGASKTISHAWVPAVGTYYIKACADLPNGVVTEASETNNCSVTALQVTFVNVTPASVDLKVGGQDNITITRASSTYLTWTSQNVSGTCSLQTPAGTLTVPANNSSTTAYPTSNLTSNTTYTLTCYGANGSSPNPVADNATVSIAVPTVTTPAPTPAACGLPGSAGTINFTYTTGANATSYRLWRNISDTSPYPTLVGTYTTLPTSDTGLVQGTRYYYQVEAINEGGSSYSNRPISALASLACGPEVDLKANGSNGPITIDDNSSVNLTWSSSNVIGNCTATSNTDQSWSGQKVANDLTSTNTFSNLSPGTHNYTITCSGANNMAATDTVTVNVVASTISVTLTANPAIVDYGSTATLTWNTSQGSRPASCSGTVGPNAWQQNNKSRDGGSESSGNLSADTTFAIRCTKSGATAVTSTVTVKVRPAAFTLTAGTAACGGNVAMTATNSVLATSYILSRNPDANNTASWGDIGTYSTLAQLQAALGQTGLVPGAVYKYQARAHNDAGYAYSNILELTATNYCPPNPPTNVTVTTGSSCLPSGTTGSATITWQAPVGGGTVSSYEVFDNNISVASGLTILSIIKTNLVAGSVHTYSVWATNENGNSDKSYSNSITIPPTCPMAPVATLYANDNRPEITISSGQSPNLTWDSSNVIANGCSISASPVTTGWPKSTLAASYPSGTAYATGALQVDTTFTLSCNGASGSNPSYTTSTVLVRVLPAAPTAVTLSPITYACSNTSNGKVGMTFGAGTGATSYVLYRSTNDPGPYSSPAAVPYSTMATYTSVATLQADQTAFTNLVAGTRYYYQVEARNTGGSAFSTRPVSAVANSVCPVGDPQVDLKVAEVLSPMPTPTAPSINASYGSSVDLTWTGSNDRSCTVSGTPGTTWNGTRSIGASQTERVTGLTAGTPYTFTLSCTNSAGKNQTAQVFVNLKPSAPTLSSSSTSCGGKVRLNLGASSFATNYELSRNPYSTPSSGYGVIASYTSSNLPSTYDDIQLTQNGVYSYQLRAYNNAGESYSQIVTVNATNGCAASVDIKGRDTNVLTTATDGPVTIENGGTVTLSWTSQNVTGVCSATPTAGDWSGQKTSSNTGTVVSGLATGNYTLGISCPGATGAVTDTIQIVVTSTPIDVTLTANGNLVSTVINPGANVVLAWTTQRNPSSCTAYGSAGDWGGSKNKNGGTQTMSALSSERNYTITCSQSGVPDTSSSVTVYVRPGPATITPTTSTCGAKIALSASPLPSNATNYNLYRSRTDTTPYDTYIGNFTSDTLPTSDNVPIASTTYYYQLQALNSLGANESTYSSRPRSAISSGPCIVSPPGVDLKVALVSGGISGAVSDGPLSVPNSSTVALSWTSHDLGSTNACTTSWSATKSNSSTGENHGPLTTARTYTITCTGLPGSSPASVTDSVTVNVNPATPDAPTLTTGTASCGANVNLNLGAVARADSYELSRSPYSQTDSGYGVIKTYTSSQLPSGSVLNYNDSGLTAGQSYSYQLRAINVSGSGYSTPIVVAQATNNCSVTPIVDLKIDGKDGPASTPVVIRYAEQGTITWSVTNAPQSSPTACDASGSSEWSGGKEVSGTQPTAPLGAEDKIYSISCVNGNGDTGRDSVYVHVPPGSIPQPDYELETSGPFILNFVSKRATSNTVTITVTPENEFNKTVTLSPGATIVGPNGATLTVSPNWNPGPTIANGSGSATFTVTSDQATKGSIVAGPYILTVTATAPTTASKTISIPVQVNVIDQTFKEF